jgi:DNA polymerase-3 subunit delta
MAPHTLNALYRDLKRDALSPAYYFHGPEDVLKDDAVTAILDRVLDPSLREFNLDQLSATQLAPEQFGDLCLALPVLAERRVLLIRDVEALKRRTKTRRVALDYLSHPSAETVLILVQGAAAEKPDSELSHLTYAVTFDPLPPERTRRWVEHRARGLGVSLAPDAVRHLVNVVGVDLAALLAELNKISAIAAEHEITVPMIEGFVGVRSGETALDWRNAVLDGDTGMAIALLPLVLTQSGVNGVRLVSALGTALVGVAIARGLSERGTPTRGLARAVFDRLRRVRPFGLPDWKDEARKWSEWAPAWPRARLDAALKHTLDADRMLKTTRLSDENGVLTDLVLRLDAVAQEVP